MPGTANKGATLETSRTAAPMQFVPYSGTPYYYPTIPAPSVQTFTTTGLVVESTEERVREFYEGPDDPRLPLDVMEMPVGRREKWVSAFNWKYWMYDPDDDPGYDENERMVVNKVRYCQKEAYKEVEKDPAPASAKEQQSGPVEQAESALIKEYMADPSIRRIREENCGQVPIASLVESEDKGGGFKTDDMIILKTGWSLNGHYFGKEVTRQIADQASGKVPGYINHGNTLGRDMRDWAVVVEEGWYSDGQANGRLHIFVEPDGKALKERIDYVRENNAPHLFGVSIDAWCRIDEGEAEGQEGVIITEVLRLNSVDVVMMPAAGGRFAPMQESLEDTMAEKNTATDGKVGEGKAEPAAPAAPVAENQELAALKQEVAELKEQLAAAKAELDAHKTAAVKQAFEHKIDQALAELSGDQSKFRQKLVEELGHEQEALCLELIAERKETLSALDDGRVTGQGPTPPAPVKQSQSTKEDRRAIFSKR